MDANVGREGGGSGLRLSYSGVTEAAGARVSEYDERRRGMTEQAFSDANTAPPALPKPAGKRLRLALSRHGRRKHGLSICEGFRCVGEALSRRPEWVDFVVVAGCAAGEERCRNAVDLCRRLDIRVYTVADADFGGYSETANPQGIMALFSPPAESAGRHHDSPPPFALVLDRVGEPGNTGTILRTAWAVGLRTVWLTDGCADPYSPKAIRAGMGAQFAIDLIQGRTLGELQPQLAREGFTRMWLSKPTGGEPCCSENFEMRGTAVVIGNEATGVADLPDADAVSIPMPGDAESLNASQAATILLYEAVRRGIL